MIKHIKLIRLYAILFIAVSSLLFSSLNAQDFQGRQKSRGMPAYPFLTEASQPNGDMIQLKGKGDGIIHWYETIDGYSVLKDKNGTYVYAQSDGEGGMEPSDHPVKSTKSSALPGIDQGLGFSNDQVKLFSEMYFEGSEIKSNPKPFPSKGINNVLVVLAEFPDQPAAAFREDIDSLMNQPNYVGIGSLRDYYLDMSYGQLTLNSTVSEWMQVSQNMSYYGGNDSYGYDLAPQVLVREAIDSLEASGFDFSQFDNDNDGYVDEIVVFHTGYGEQFVDAGDTCIWSHAYHLGDLSVVYDGVILDNYIIGPELYSTSGAEVTSIGTMVHEFGHSLAMPDLYDYDQQGSGGYAWDLNFWDLMGAGSWNDEGYSPAGINAWLKEYLGWLTIPEISASGAYTLNNVYENQEAYRINTTTDDEYFILENRQWYGFDYEIPGYGMLIYHVDRNYPGWQTGNINVDPSHQGFDLEEADNIRDSLTIDGDSYPGWDTITSFSSLTSPNSNAWNGRVTPIAIENITQIDSVIIFDLVNSMFDNAPPAWDVDPGSFSNTGSIYAMVHIGSDTASTGFLSAFVGAECRGVVIPTFYPDSNYHVFELDVYSNTLSGEMLTFQYYDPLLDSIYQMLETIEFTTDSIAGDFVSPYHMYAPTKYQRDFVPGWNWFSINVDLDDMNPNNVLSSCASAGDYIKSQTQSTTYYEGYGWFGTMATLNNEDLYLINTGNGCSIDVSGISADPSSTLLTIVPGWNWVSYLPQEVMSPSEALSSLSPSNMDYVKNQTGSTTYYAGYGWFGTLNTMFPGQGYMINMANGGTLIYPSSSSVKKATGKLSGEDVASFKESHTYEYNGTITASVSLDGLEVNIEKDRLYAFVGDECRGFVKGQYFQPEDKVVFPLMVYSNQMNGEVFSFKYFQSQSGKLYDCNETIVFDKDMVIGDAINTKSLNVKGSILSDELRINNANGLNVHPNPFSDYVEIEYAIKSKSYICLQVFDIYGRLVETISEGECIPGEYQLKWTPGTLESGSYFIRYTDGQKTAIKQINYIN